MNFLVAGYLAASVFAVFVALRRYRRAMEAEWLWSVRIQPMLRPPAREYPVLPGNLVRLDEVRNANRLGKRYKTSTPA